MSVAGAARCVARRRERSEIPAATRGARAKKKRPACADRFVCNICAAVASHRIGAGNETRTRDIYLGKVVLYQ
ncbi:hypothetical protein, partial [Lysobacter enzymogenes]|uniref:hypothetical protein n=1 Tax=Lysobacter enzymogenes TaxID=69 RepID=UPI0019D2FF40